MQPMVNRIKELKKIRAKSVKQNTEKQQRNINKIKVYKRLIKLAIFQPD